MKNLSIYSFYRFLEISNKKQIKKNLDSYFKFKVIRGTILLADEGINASISGDNETLEKTVKFIKRQLKIRKLDIKINNTNFLPFNKMKVRLKKEIVSLGVGNFKSKNFHGKYIHPSGWNDIIFDKNTKVIDVRNIYEINIGKFKNSINPSTNTFREFPKKINNLKLSKKDKIAMYCTGGIRCEKASAFLKMKGYENVVQLKGGIIKYLEYTYNKKETSNWQGECFVFDDRVSINNSLDKGKYLQCYGCRRPITKKDTRSILYKKGVSCPYCYKERTHEQKKRSLIRQKQIDMAERKEESHPFKRLETL